MTKINQENPIVEMDLEELEVQDAEDVIEQQEELAKKLEEMRKSKRSFVDILEFELRIRAEDLSSFVPSFCSKLWKDDAEIS